MTFVAVLSFGKIFPLQHNPLLQTEVFHGKTLAVFHPALPRVPHHIAISFHRKAVQSIADVTEMEHRELFQTMRKIAEIYKTIGIEGFVVAFKGNIVEMIPHLPGFQKIKHLVDKYDCNRYVLFEKAPVSKVEFLVDKEHALFWREAFQKEHPALTESDWKIEFPYTRYESHHEEAALLAQKNLLELKGLQQPQSLFIVPEALAEVRSVAVPCCMFCNEEVIRSQTVCEYRSVLIFYNIRLGEQPGCNFLILPKRHIEKIYGLTEEEVEDIRVARQALMEVLQEAHPQHQTVIYIQDASSTGQTVPHTHEQVVSLNPTTTPLFWTEQSLRAGSRVFDEEMRGVCEAFGSKLRARLEHASEQSA